MYRLSILKIGLLIKVGFSLISFWVLVLSIFSFWLLSNCRQVRLRVFISDCQPNFSMKLLRRLESSPSLRKSCKVGL